MKKVYLAYISDLLYNNEGLYCGVYSTKEKAINALKKFKSDDFEYYDEDFKNDILEDYGNKENYINSFNYEKYDITEIIIDEEIS